VLVSAPRDERVVPDTFGTWVGPLKLLAPLTRRPLRTGTACSLWVGIRLTTVFHPPAVVTMTVLLHSRPPSPAGSGRLSVTAMCTASLTAASGRAALRWPSASLR